MIPKKDLTTDDPAVQYLMSMFSTTTSKMTPGYFADFQNLGFIEEIKNLGKFTYSDVVELKNQFTLPEVLTIGYVKFFTGSTAKVVVNNFYLSKAGAAYFVAMKTHEYYKY